MTDITEAQNVYMEAIRNLNCIQFAKNPSESKDKFMCNSKECHMYSDATFGGFHCRFIQIEHMMKTIQSINAENTTKKFEVSVRGTNLSSDDIAQCIHSEYWKANVVVKEMKS